MTGLNETSARARLSAGTSHAAIYRMIGRALSGRQRIGLLLDIGCGRQRLVDELDGRFDRYVGIDVVAYGDRARQPLVLADLESGLPVRDAVADVAIAVETIEHLENPRAFLRELARVVRPGGTVVITTPNQLSALSLLTLIVKRRFAAFQDVHYPAHRTALLEVDLRRIVAEAGLVAPHIEFSLHSRVPLTSLAYPGWMSRRAPALLSDNVLISARKPAGNMGS